MKILLIYKCLLIGFIFALFVPYMAIASAGDAPPDDVIKAAKEEINTNIKNRRFDKGFNDLGFDNQDDIDNADLGGGFQVFTIPSSKLLDDSVPQDIQSLVPPTTEWDFLVVSKNKANTILEVRMTNGKWAPGAIGSSVLAKEMSGIFATWPASAGYQYKFIRVYASRSDLIELSREGVVIGIIPLTELILTPGRISGKFKPNDLRNPNDVLMNLRNAAKRKIELNKNQNINTK